MNSLTLTRKIRRLEARARRLWNLRLFPGAPEYALADNLWSRAQALRTTNPPPVWPALTPEENTRLDSLSA